MELIQGKRYEWYINNYEDKKKNGLFTPGSMISQMAMQSY